MIIMMGAKHNAPPAGYYGAPRHGGTSTSVPAAANSAADQRIRQLESQKQFAPQQRTAGCQPSQEPVFRPKEPLINS